jgi:hypothetical protein
MCQSPCLDAKSKSGWLATIGWLLMSGLSCTSASSPTTDSPAGTVTGISTGVAGDRARRAVIPARFGVHSDIAWYASESKRAGMMTTLRALHPRVVRIELHWAFIEWTKGHQDWSIYDQIVGDLRDAGIEPLFYVISSPPWANGADPASSPTYYLDVPTKSAAFSTWVAEYAVFIRAAATRYKGRVTLWEIGNEPNTDAFWEPKANPGQYAQWFLALDSAIRDVDARNQTAVGGLAALHVWYGSGGINGCSFLQTLYSLGLRPANVAIHPYPSLGQSADVNVAGANNFDDIQLAHDVMIANGQGAAGLWVTEWGWNTGAGVSESTQAAYVRASLDRLVSLYPYVSIATYFSHFDTPAVNSYYGLYRADGSAKPAAAAFADFLRP